jgi:hypothetical protein
MVILSTRFKISDEILRIIHERVYTRIILSDFQVIFIGRRLISMPYRTAQDIPGKVAARYVRFIRPAVGQCLWSGRYGWCLRFFTCLLGLPLLELSFLFLLTIGGWIARLRHLD